MRTAETFSTRRSCWLVLFVVAFGLNWLWEMLQMPAYEHLPGRSWRQKVLVCTLASLGDACLTLLVYGVGVLAIRRLRWNTRGGLKAYVVTGLLGAACAVVIEWVALASGRWSYSDRMPAVLGVGLWPLLQFALLMPLSLWITVRWWTHSTARIGRKI